MATLSTLYASVLVSSMFLPPILIKTCGCKWTIVGSMCCYVAFSLGNFHASWYSPPSRTFPVCVLSLGPSCLPLWLLTVVVTLSFPWALSWGLAFTHRCHHGPNSDGESDVDDSQGDSASNGPMTHSPYPQILRAGQRGALACVGTH